MTTDSDKECLHAWELMPWVLQESATEAQTEWLMQHLGRCEACLAEFAQQSRLRQAMSLPAEVAPDAEAGLQRLLGRLDAPDTQPAAPARPRSGSWLTRALAAAVLVQAIGVGVLGAKLGSVDTKPVYRTLSDTSAPAAPGGAIRVVPDAGMSLSAWNALLHTLDLQVVGGPNGVGAYTVVAIDPAATPQAQAVQRLRATRGIQLAEPVSAP